MKKEIVINADKEQTRIAILEDGNLVELYFEDAENERTLGNVYLGRIRRIMPSIQAAFVDIGQKQDAFLHFSDLGDALPELLEFADMDNPAVEKLKPQPERQRARQQRRRPKGQRGGRRGGESPEDDGSDGQGKRDRAQARGKRRSAQRSSQKKGGGGDTSRKAQKKADNRPPHELLKRGQRIPVKIVKEPISNKGSRVSTDISLAGRFLVLVPFGNYVAVSKKIQSYKERRRLRALAKMLLPDGFGVIVRTVADGKDAKTLDTDLRLLMEKWRKIEGKLEGRPDAPKVIYEDVNMASSIIRDLFSSDYDRILVDDPRLHRSIRSYVQAVAPQMAPAVKLHESKKSVFEAVKVDRDVAQVFESRVDLPSGGYLFIERTEAMHVIDVNSGRSGRGMRQEESSLKVNIEAARVIAKQTRLRDIGGIIVVDFIDLRSEKHKRMVYDELKKEFRRDRAVTKLLPMSDFGLIQITRQRLRPSITTTFSAPTSSKSKDEGSGSTNGRRSSREKSSRETSPREQSSRDKGASKKPADEVAAPAEATREHRARGRGGASRAKAPQPDKLLKELDAWIAEYKAQGKRRAVTLRVHPFTAAFLNRRVPNHPTRWFMKHLVRVRLEVDATVLPSVYQFVDPRSGEVLNVPAEPARAEDATETKDTRKPDAKDTRRPEAKEVRKPDAKDTRKPKEAKEVTQPAADDDSSSSETSEKEDQSRSSGRRGGRRGRGGRGRSRGGSRQGGQSQKGDGEASKASSADKGASDTSSKNTEAQNDGDAGDDRGSGNRGGGNRGGGNRSGGRSRGRSGSRRGGSGRSGSGRGSSGRGGSDKGADADGGTNKPQDAKPTGDAGGESTSGDESKSTESSQSGGAQKSNRGRSRGRRGGSRRRGRGRGRGSKSQGETSGDASNRGSGTSDSAKQDGGGQGGAKQGGSKQDSAKQGGSQQEQSGGTS